MGSKKISLFAIARQILELSDIVLSAGATWIVNILST